MVQIILTPAQRKDHRAEAHHLNPVVMIGSDGLTDAVKKETDAALKAHGLIKVRAAIEAAGAVRPLAAALARHPSVREKAHAALEKLGYTDAGVKK